MSVTIGPTITRLVHQLVWLLAILPSHVMLASTKSIQLCPQIGPKAPMPAIYGADLRSPASTGTVRLFTDHAFHDVKLDISNFDRKITENNNNNVSTDAPFADQLGPAKAMREMFPQYGRFPFMANSWRRVSMVSGQVPSSIMSEEEQLSLVVVSNRRQSASFAFEKNNDHYYSNNFNQFTMRISVWNSTTRALASDDPDPKGSIRVTDFVEAAFAIRLSKAEQIFLVIGQQLHHLSLVGSNPHSPSAWHVQSVDHLVRGHIPANLTAAFGISPSLPLLSSDPQAQLHLPTVVLFRCRSFCRVPWLPLEYVFDFGQCNWEPLSGMFHSTMALPAVASEDSNASSLYSTLVPVVVLGFLILLLLSTFYLWYRTEYC